MAKAERISIPLSPGAINTLFTEELCMEMEE